MSKERFQGGGSRCVSAEIPFEFPILPYTPTLSSQVLARFTIGFEVSKRGEGDTMGREKIVDIKSGFEIEQASNYTRAP